MFRLFERLMTLAFLLMIVGVLTVVFIGSGSHERSLAEGLASTGPSRIGEALIYTGTATLIVLKYKRLLVACRAAWPFFALAFFAVISTAWSVDPGTTLRRSLVLLSSTTFGVYLGGRYTVHELQRFLLQFFLIMVTASLLLVAVAPSYALDTYHGGALRGITEHKNRFGEYMGIFLLASLTYRFQGRPRYLHLGMVLLAAVMLLASRSGTSLLAVAAVSILLPALVTLRFVPKQVFPLAILATLGLIFAVYELAHASGAVLDLLGKDSTLTGRAEIWAGALTSIERRPLLGYGYDAFWQGLKGESLQIVARVGWLVPHAHNGYLEGLLGFGLTGMGVLLVGVVRAARDAGSYLRRVRGLAGFWPFAFLVYFLVHATAEASLIEREGLSYLLFIATSTTLALERARFASGKSHVPSCVLREDFPASHETTSAVPIS